MACSVFGAKLFGPLEKKFQWNYNQNSYISIEENEFENVVCNVVTILSQPQCINGFK